MSLTGTEIAGSPRMFAVIANCIRLAEKNSKRVSIKKSKIKLHHLEVLIVAKRNVVVLRILCEIERFKTFNIEVHTCLQCLQKSNLPKLTRPTLTQPNFGGVMTRAAQ